MSGKNIKEINDLQDLCDLSVKDKIESICESKTNIERLYLIKKSNLKITKQQSVYILNRFSLGDYYHKDYLYTLVEMGFDINVLPDFKQKYDLGIKHVRYDESCILYQILHIYMMEDIFERGISLRKFDNNIIKLIFGEPFMDNYTRLLKNEEYHMKEQYHNNHNNRNDNQMKISPERLQWIKDNVDFCKNEYEMSNLDLLLDLLRVCDFKKNTNIKIVKLQGFCTGNLLGFFKAALRSYADNSTEYMDKVYLTIRRLVECNIDINAKTKVIYDYNGKPIYRCCNLVESIIGTILEHNNLSYENHNIDMQYLNLLIYIFTIEDYVYVPTSKHVLRKNTDMQMQIQTQIQNSGENENNNSNNNYHNHNAYAGLISLYDRYNDTKYRNINNIYKTLLEIVFRKIDSKKDYIGFNTCCDKIVESGNIGLFHIFSTSTEEIKRDIEKINSMKRSFYSKYFIMLAEKGFLSFMKKILEIDPSIDVDHVSYGDTALKIACRRGDLNMAKFLIEKGSNLFMFDDVFSPYKSILGTAKTTLWCNEDLVSFLVSESDKKKVTI